jgi:putative transposase
MKPISFARHPFLPEVIRQALWSYFRFILSFRDVEDLISARGMEVSHKTIRSWTLKFGTLFGRTSAGPDPARPADGTPTK